MSMILNFVAHPMQASASVRIGNSSGDYSRDTDRAFNIEAWLAYRKGIVQGMVADLPAPAERDASGVPSVEQYIDTEQWVRKYNTNMPAALRLNSRFTYLFEGWYPGPADGKSNGVHGTIRLKATGSIMTSDGLCRVATYDIALHLITQVQTQERPGSLHGKAKAPVNPTPNASGKRLGHYIAGIAKSHGIVKEHQLRSLISREGLSFTYTTAAGDTLAEIAQALGRELRALHDIHTINDPFAPLPAGLTLLIPELKPQA